MPIHLSKTALLERAFLAAPSEINAVFEQKLQKLYGEHEPPYDGKDITQGTLKEKESLPVIDIERVAHFNSQFSRVITTLSQSSTKLRLTAQQLKNLSTFSKNFQSRRYYPGQNSAYYARVKHTLEIITLRLADDSVSIDTKISAIHNLLDNIAYCGPGIFNHLQETMETLTTENSIESWLASFRKLIVKQLAEQHITRKRISAGDTIHVHNVFFAYARNENWNLQGEESLSALNEIHASLARIKAEDIVTLHRHFFKRYTPLTIMTHITETLHAKLCEKIKKAIVKNNCIEIMNESRLKIFFGDLPIIGDEDWIRTLFNIDENNHALSQNIHNNLPFIKMGSYHLRLKSPDVLKLSLTNHFVNSNKSLFQVHEIEPKKGLKYGFIPNAPALCYVASKIEDTIHPFNDKLIPIDLSLCKNFKIPPRLAAILTNKEYTKVSRETTAKSTHLIVQKYIYKYENIVQSRLSQRQSKERRESINRVKASLNELKNAKPNEVKSKRDNLIARIKSDIKTTEQHHNQGWFSWFTQSNLACAYKNALKEIESYTPSSRR